MASGSSATFPNEELLTEDPGLSRDPVDPSVDLTVFHRLLTGEISSTWRPGEWDHAALVFTGDPARIDTLISSCRFPGCRGAAFNRILILCSVCEGRFRRHTSRLGNVSVDRWVEGAVDLQQTTWSTRIPPVLCSVPVCSNRSKRFGVPLLSTAEDNPKKWHRRKIRTPPLCLGHQPPATVENVGEWITAQHTKPFIAAYCSVPWCGYKPREGDPLGLCVQHSRLVTDRSALERYLEQEAVTSLEPGGYREIHPPETTSARYSFSLKALARTHPGLATELLWTLQYQDSIGYPVNLLTTKALISSALRFPASTRSFLSADTAALASTQVMRSGSASAMFRVVRARILERYVPWITGGDLLRSDLIPFGLLHTPSNRSKSKRSMSVLDFRPIRPDWARQMAKLWILERSTTETSSMTLISHIARLCDELTIRSAAHRLPSPADAALLTRAHGKLLAQTLASMTLLNGKPMPNERKRMIGSALAGMIDHARKNSDLFEHTSLAFALDYDLLIPVEEAAGADGDDETGRAVPEPVIEFLFEQLTAARVASPTSAAVPNHVFVAAFTCFMTLLRDAGRRPGETAGLTRDCLSYDSDGRPTLLWHNDKGRRRGRRLPIWTETARALEDWFAVRDRHIGAMPAGQHNWLFPTFRQRVRDSHLDNIWFNAPAPGLGR